MGLRIGFIAAALVAGISSQASAALFQDIVVMMDSSGSLGAANWNAQEQFVEELNETMPDRTSRRLGVVQFSTNNYIRHHLTDSQIAADVSTVVDSLGYLTGSTYIKNAMQTVINFFDAESAPTTAKLVIYVTDDGVPNPSVSQDPTSLVPSLVSRNIPVLVVSYSAPHAVWTNITSQTGGAEYQYSAVDAAAVPTFLTDAGSYFPTPEPSSGVTLLILAAWALRPARRRARTH